MLSAIAAFTDRVEAMHAGCDDYLAKRYAFAEVLAHLEALGRRADRVRGPSVLRVADLELDTQASLASRGGQVIRLQPRQSVRIAQRTGATVSAGG